MVTQASDRAKGCERVVKVRTKTPKKSFVNTESQHGTSQSGGGGTSSATVKTGNTSGVTGNGNTNIGTASGGSRKKMNEGTQAGYTR